MSRYRSEIIVILFLIITTLTVYWGVRNHDFLNYDDGVYITRNNHVKAGWTVEGVTWAFTTKFHRHWHPLAWLSHMTDCQLFGLNPGWHHMSSLFLHLANTVLLFFVLNLITGALLRSAFVAALFALHPLHVEPVVWVASRKDVLSTFFWMLAMLVYVRYSKYPGFVRYILVLIAFILGLMSKSMVVTLPFVLLLMDYWPLKNPLFGQSKGERNTLNHKPLQSIFQRLLELRVIWDKAALLIIVGASSVVALLAMQMKTVSNLDTLALLPTRHYISNTFVSYISYIGKMFWPVNLAIPYPRHHVISVWQAGGCGLLLICISFLVFWKRRHYPYLLVGWLWYLITLVPVIGIVRSGPGIMADRYTYIPLIGLFIIIAWGVPDLLKAWRYRRIMLATLTGILLLGFMTSSWFQVRYWKNSITLFKHTIDVTANNHEAHKNLGAALTVQGKLEEAIVHYSKALSIKPNYAEAYNKLGLALAAQGKLNEAVANYSKALSIKPDYAKAHNNLGLALAKQGKMEEASSHFSKALSIEPNYAEAHNNIGLVLADQGKIKEAIGHFSEALRIKPNLMPARYNLELVQRLLGESRRAPNIDVIP